MNPLSVNNLFNRKSMKLFAKLFVVLFFLELILYSVIGNSHTLYHPLVYLPIIPAARLATAIGGTNAGFWSFLPGLIITAAAYATAPATVRYISSELLRIQKEEASKRDE
jgi:uncharacterized membrane protein YeiH